jgi:hypothetical protein
MQYIARNNLQPKGGRGPGDSGRRPSGHDGRFPVVEVKERLFVAGVEESGSQAAGKLIMGRKKCEGGTGVPGHSYSIGLARPKRSKINIELWPLGRRNTGRAPTPTSPASTISRPTRSSRNHGPAHSLSHGDGTGRAVHFEFASGALHLHHVIGGKPAADGAIQRRTSPDALAVPAFESSFQTLANCATHNFPLRPSASLAITETGEP